MLYILESLFPEFSNKTSLWDIDHDNPLKSYKKFMVDKAEKIGITVNPHWLNIMSHKTYHSHLSESEYLKLKKEWKKILKKYPLKRYIAEELKGKEVEYKKIIW